MKTYWIWSKRDRASWWIIRGADEEEVWQRFIREAPLKAKCVPLTRAEAEQWYCIGQVTPDERVGIIAHFMFVTPRENSVSFRAA